MNILVTGAAGFIGSNLCNQLCKKGFQVTGLDNLSTGHKHNITSLLSLKNFHFIQGDITDVATCRKIMVNQQVVMHQAALGSVPRSLKDPLTTNSVNISGFLNMLHASVENKVSRFIYAASSSTYGDSKDLPKVEDRIGNPLSPYAVTKYVNELYADVYSKNFPIETIGLRYFNVFGRHQDPHGAYAAVIPLFIKQFMNLQPVTINGDGSFSRDFTYIDNVVQANMLAMDTNNPLAVNNVYNVAYGHQTSILQLAQELRDQLAQRDKRIAAVPIHFGEPRQGDVPHSLASIKKARELLGYAPQFDLKEGLKESIQWYWENL